MFGDVKTFLFLFIVAVISSVIPILFHGCSTTVNRIQIKPQKTKSTFKQQRIQQREEFISYNTSSGSKILLEKLSRDYNHTTQYPTDVYAIKLHLSDKNLTMLLDSSTSNVFVFCCDSPVRREFCAKTWRCEKFDCESGSFEKQCQNWIHVTSLYERDGQISYDHLAFDQDYFQKGIWEKQSFSIDGKNFLTDVFISTVWTEDAYWRDIDGVFGIANAVNKTADKDEYSYSRSFTNFMRTFYPNSMYFALDFNPNDESYLLLGDAATDHPKYPPNKILWTQKQYRLTDYYLSKVHEYTNQFTIYNLTFCGVPLFSNYTSNWQVTINTGIEGIALPAEFYRMIFAWLKNSTSPDIPLPSLSFRLEENGPELYISLASLKDKDTFHIYQSNEILYYYARTIMSTEPQIVFGTRVLQNLYSIFDMNKGVIGFAQKDTFSYPVITPNCATSQQQNCKGQQTYYAPMNICLDPQCSSYLFQRVDENKNCVMRFEFYIVFGIILMCFATGEFLVIELYRRLSQYLANRGQN